MEYDFLKRRFIISKISPSSFGILQKRKIQTQISRFIELNLVELQFSVLKNDDFIN